MPASYFPPPPIALLPAEQQGWLMRIKEAETIVGVTEAGMPLVSGETLALLRRYVQGELSLDQVIRLQCQRLSMR